MKTALLVIDVQKVYTDESSDLYCPDAVGTVERINQLIELFTQHNAPVIYIRHMHKADGSDAGRLFDFTGEADDIGFVENTEEVEFDDQLVRLAGYKEIIKHRYSSFAGTSLDKDLQKLGVERVAICGFMTNFCCESAARDALDRDYYVDFITDATGTPGTPEMDEEKVRSVVAELLGVGFANIYDTAEYIESFGRNA